MKKDQVASISLWKLVPSPPPPPPPWIELPEDIAAKILHKLGPIGMLWTAQRVCTTWRKICRDPTMWRVLDMWKLAHVSEPRFTNAGIPELCRLVVYLSQGHVTEINVDELTRYYLIDYFGPRCGQLKCLRLGFCYKSCLKSIGKHFPLLEELHLLYTYIKKDDIETIGQSCPMLKTFALIGYGSRNGVLEVSKETLAIAEYMPELRHLQLFGNGMTNEELEVILDGCPKLESLELRRCYNLDLEGELGKRCAELIKTLKCPHDSVNEYEFGIKIPCWDSSSDDSDPEDLDDDDYNGAYEFSDPDRV